MTKPASSRRMLSAHASDGLLRPASYGTVTARCARTPRRARRSGVLDLFDAIVRRARRDVDFDDLANRAVLQRVADGRLDRDALMAGIHLARADQRVLQLLVELQVAQYDPAAQARALVADLALDDARRLDLALEA